MKTKAIKNIIGLRKDLLEIKKIFTKSYQFKKYIVKSTEPKTKKYYDYDDIE